MIQVGANDVFSVHFLIHYFLEWVFIVGGMSFGCFSLGGGFVRSEIPLLVLRALMGVGMCIPSSIFF